MEKDLKKLKERSSKKWIYFLGILLAFLLVAAVAYVGWLTWGKYRDDIISKQKEEMLLITDSLADSLQENIAGYDTDLEYLSDLVENVEQMENPLEAQKKLLSQYIDKHLAYVKNLVYYDQDGNILWQSSNQLLETQYDDFHLDSGVEMKVAMGTDNQLYFVLENDLSTGKKLQLYIDVNEYYNNMISDIRLGTNGYVVVKSTEGVIYMHPEKAQIGVTIIDGRKDLYGDLDLDSLANLLEDQNAKESAVLEYYSYWWSNKNLPRVQKIAAHTHANCGDGYMIVSIVMDYDDIYQPIVSGYITILATYGGIVVIVLFLAAILMWQVVQGRRNQQEIAYLKDLNEVLEETKRGEEVIAHQQRLQIMGTMTGGIAHEFNNLLTPIMGYSEMLVDMLPPDSDEADFAQEIFDASDKAKDIIKQISGLSRKNMETVYTFVPLKKALKRTTKMVRSVCPANVMFIESNDFQEEGFLGNETQLNQVILNICVNAFHAIGKEKDGRVSLRGEIHSKEELAEKFHQDLGEIWKEYLCIYIEDNGCGMEPEVLEQIFNPFFTTKVGGQGTGLGLSVAEQIIRSHQGHIFVESIPGRGTCFTICLPKVNRPQHGVSKNEMGEDVSLRILAVDDNGHVLRLLEKRFAKLKVDITTASNTEEARKALSESKYEVVLIDQQLSRTSGGDTGIQFAMAVGSAYPDIIKIVMADQVRKEIIEAKQHGYINGYVEKPVSDASILEEIYKCMH